MFLKKLSYQKIQGESLSMVSLMDEVCRQPLLNKLSKTVEFIQEAVL